MNLERKTTSCNPSQIALFLDGILDEQVESSFIEHLSFCASCCELLEQSVASKQAWRDVGALLQETSVQMHSNSSRYIKLDRQDRQELFDVEMIRGSLQPSDDPNSLGRLGTYEITGVVGVGGMGIVLKAVDLALDRTMAIKVLAPNLAASGIARKRFSREAKAAAAVLHPNVIAIYSVVNEDSGLPYLVMPYIRGQSLQRRIDSKGMLDVREILRIGCQVASGLSAAHAQGLIHRDIKPANILLDDGVERVTITDFGLARTVDDASLTHSGMIAGTPAYMSPEQVQGETLDHRSDLYSLGSVLYATCTGKPPFRAETAYGVMKRICEDTPTKIQSQNPDIPEWLVAVIEWLMVKEPSQRLQSAQELESLFKDCLAHLEQPHLVPLPTSVCELQCKARIAFRSQLYGVCAALVLLLVLLAWPTYDLLTQNRSGNMPRDPNDKAKNVDPVSRAQAPNPQDSASFVDVDKFRVIYRGMVDTSLMRKAEVIDQFRWDMRSELTNSPNSQLSRDRDERPSEDPADRFDSYTFLHGNPEKFWSPIRYVSDEQRTMAIAVEIKSLDPNTKYFAELGRRASIAMTNGAKVDYQAPASKDFRSAELERMFPHASFFHVHRFDGGAYNPLFQKALAPVVIESELLISPGVTYEVEFEGLGPQTKIVRGQKFVLESIAADSKGIEIIVRFPRLTLKRLASNEDEKGRAKAALRSAYSAILQDNRGEYHAPMKAIENVLPDTGADTDDAIIVPFQFDSLPEDRTIKSIGVTFKDRTGPTESVPFQLQVN